MSKNKTYYLCRNCGAMQPKWLGKCPECGAWDSLEEMAKATEDPHRPKAIGAMGAEGHAAATLHAQSDSEPMAVADIPPLATNRIATGIGEFDRVLGGGVVPGSAILLGGDPGIGKSTLLLQAGDQLARSGHTVLYVSSEESAQQTGLRAKRLNAGHEKLLIYAEANMEKISRQIQRVRPSLCIIDSVQLIYSPDNPSAPGSISQLRGCCSDLVYLAKAGGSAVCLVGHVTKQGMFAGPKLLEHIVDTVLYFEGDTHHNHRIVRCVKNRFGNTLEVGLFQMSEGGLEEVSDSATLLLEAHSQAQPGSIVTATLQGSRVLLVEVQALTAESMLGVARRKVSGCDANRVSMIIAVLEKRAGLRLVDRDVFVNVVGGIRLADPAGDAAIALAIAGAHKNRAMSPRTVVLGELGLLGEFRGISHLEMRLSEAARLGFDNAILPKARSGKATRAENGRLRMNACGLLDEALEHLA